MAESTDRTAEVATTPRDDPTSFAREVELHPAARLRAFAHAVLEATGMAEGDAAIAADAMVWADLRGLEAHGIGHKLSQCVARIRAGGTSATPAPETVDASPSVVVLDADNAWGQCAATRAMEAAIERAEAVGVGLAIARNLSSAAAMGYYPMVAVERGLIGIAITNGPSLMPPWGGTTRMLGNFGHAIGVPARRHFPILFDSALSAMSTGEMDVLHERGALLPEGVLLDRFGAPTLDAGAWSAGLLVPAGGHRGYGLALMFEILTGVLAGGSRFAPNVGSPNAHADPQGVSLFAMAIDPSASMSRDDFVARVDELIDRVHASPPADGFDRVYVPGERGFLTARAREADGIPLASARVTKLRALGEEFGVAW